MLASNPSTLKAVAGVQSQPGLQSKTLSQKEAERSRSFLLWTMTGGPPDVWTNIPKRPDCVPAQRLPPSGIPS